MRIAFLGHNQPTDGTVRPSGGYLSKEDADRLVQEMRVEKISNKVIRAFSPNSVFPALNPALNPASSSSSVRCIPTLLASIEIGGVKFVHPTSQAARSLAVRHRLALKAFLSSRQVSSGAMRISA
jgi:hypothetical protein